MDTLTEDDVTLTEDGVGMVGGCFPDRLLTADRSSWLRAAWTGGCLTRGFVDGPGAFWTGA